MLPLAKTTKRLSYLHSALHMRVLTLRWYFRPGEWSVFTPNETAVPGRDFKALNKMAIKQGTGSEFHFRSNPTNYLQMSRLISQLQEERKHDFHDCLCQFC